MLNKVFNSIFNNQMATKITAKPALGDLAKDKISGFTGIVTARTEWLNKCVRVQLSPDKLQKDGTVIDSQTFDEEQVEVIKQAAIKVNKQQTGGDRPGPVQRSGPTR
jgi:hypothetical protein